jgi:hypothetical protein
MNWEEIRHRYPKQWLLVEAIQAHSEASNRILEQLAVISTYPDSTTALSGYRQFHQKSPDRELYVFHTSRENLNVTERRWMGIRSAK